MRDDIVIQTPEPSHSILRNPNRGAYHFYAFTLDGTADLGNELRNQLHGSKESLALIEVNLVNYRQGDLPDSAIQQLEDLFKVLQESHLHGIIRFLYDWDGDTLGKEPASIEIIQSHMRSVAPVLLDYKEDIYTTQGLFVGAWGEMHDSDYVDKDSLQDLADTFRNATDGKIRMAVRTPAQWRIITESDSAEHVSKRWKMLGLYNDGMLGSETDFGTYSLETTSEDGLEVAWSRKEELELQDHLCLKVPNGGEVINPNPYNDLDHAIRDFRKMHVTYLNPDYDAEVMDKWEKVKMKQGDLASADKVFAGMSGREYILSHLGYRYVVTEVRATRGFWGKTTSLQIDLCNVGFAPSYEPLQADLVVMTEGGSQIFRQKLKGDISLLDGTDAEVIGTLACELQQSKIRKMIRKKESESDDTDYGLYLQVTDMQGNPVYLGNVSEKVEEGLYKIGEYIEK